MEFASREGKATTINIVIAHNSYILHFLYTQQWIQLDSLAEPITLLYLHACRWTDRCQDYMYMVLE